MITLREIESYKEYGKVLCIENGTVQAKVTLDVGPRVISFGFIGGQNIMHSERSAFDPIEDDVFHKFFGEGKKWENLGGHRIWTSPESYPEVYYPDLKPVKYEKTEFGVVLTPNPEKENGIAKQMEVKMDPDDCNMQVIMRVKNISEKPIDFAIWGLSVCAPGGTLIIPTNDNDTGLLSNRLMSIWPYTDLRDERIYFGKRYVTLKQDVNATTPVKLGFDLNCGTAYYVLGDDIFCKRFATNHPSGRYPDGGCSFETYTNSVFIEVESLGELNTVNPGETSVLAEHWSVLKKPCAVDTRDDASIDNFLSKI